MDKELDYELETDEEKISIFFDEYENYILNETIPEVVAHYLAKAYKMNLLSPCPIRNHINSALDIFNIECELESIYSKIENILYEKYNLKIVNPKNSEIIKIQ